jgi:hypothetical protein
MVVSEHIDLMPSEDGQLTETCKGNKYLLIESHWTVLTIILQFNFLTSDCIPFCNLLAYNTVYCDRQGPAFWRNMIPLLSVKMEAEYLSRMKPLRIFGYNRKCEKVGEN